MRARLALAGLLILSIAAGCAPKTRGSQDTSPDAGGPSPSANAGDGAATAPFIRIVSPRPGDVLAGNVELEFEFSKHEGASLWVGVAGEPLNEVRGGARIFISSYAFPDGEHTLVAELRDESGDQWGDEVEVSFDNPDQQLLSLQADNFEYKSGETIELSVEYSDPDLVVSADFSALDSAYDAARVEVEDQGAGQFQIRYRLSEANSVSDGRHPVVVRSINQAGEERLDELQLTLAQQDELPIVVKSGTFVAGPAPELTTAQAASEVLSSVAAGDTLLRGGSTELTVTYKNDPERPIDKVLITIPGFSGYYLVAAPEPVGSETELTLTLELPPQAPGFDDGVLGIGTGLLDGLGQIVDWVSETVTAISVGGDGVQVSLTWDNDVDLDLSVTDPTGLEIDFENPAQGEGALDLDSNALCEIDGTNAENISWQPGDEPQGIYQVRVALYDVCDDDIVTWHLTARFCGHAETFSGTLTTANVDTSGGGEVVTEFTVECNQVVRGTVIREKINDISKPGIRELDVVPFAPIRIVNGSTTLAQGVTDSRGRYDLRFQNLDQDDYVVEVEASWVDPATNEVRARVTPLDDGTAHRFKTPEILGSDTLVRTENPRIKVEDGSGAFNILAGIRNGFTWVSTNVSVSKSDGLDPMRGHWEEGGNTSISNSYQLGDDLFIQGTTDLPQQWSDSVIMHEFMHYVVRKLSFSPLPGGSHSFEGKAGPHLMWSEGLATALGQDSLNASLYADRRPGTAFLYDIETLDSKLEGTTGNTRTGNLNEFMVSAVVWDVLDPANETWDKLQERSFGFGSMFTNIPADRDMNGLDLVDFLDQVRSDSPSGSVNEDLKCMTDKVKFPYDYPAGTMCPP